MSQDLFDILKKGCTGGVSAIRCRVHFEAADGDGGKAFPPTYKDGQYATEERWKNNEKQDVVLLDSVQSQANRFEQSLKEAVDREEIQLPLLTVDIPDYGRYTSLDVPHRVHDAIFRDTLLGGTPFRQSQVGKAIVNSYPGNATALLTYAPHALLFGTWDSQGGAGLRGAKFARCLVSEILAVDAKVGTKTSSRIDPLGIKAVKAVWKKDDGWTAVTDAEQVPAGTKLLKPSEINHGNVTPTISKGGVTFKEAIQTAVLSLTQVRKLRFPVESESSSERDVAGRCVVAALGLYAIARQFEDGYQLRSRCLLIPKSEAQYELIGMKSSDLEPLSITLSMASEALGRAIDAAKGAGLPWKPETIELQPNEALLRLVKISEAAKAEAESEG